MVTELMQLSFSPTSGTVRTPGMSGLFGLGLDPGTQQIAAIAAQGAALTGSIVAMLPGFAMAGPIGAAVAGLVAVGIGIAKLFSGCGQTCVQATQVANQLQVYWQQNLDHYQSSSPRYLSVQKAALNNFDTGWNAMLKMCGDPSLGSAGQRCISERQRGGTAPWCPTANHTGCDAFVTFRDPIANDPLVVPDPPGTQSSGGLLSGMSLPIPLLLGAGLLMFAMVGSGD